MVTDFEHEVFVLATSATIGPAIAVLDVAFPCDDGSKRDATRPENYASKYSASGQDPATHYGAAFVITEAQRQSLESAGLNQVPGITYWRTTNPEGILALSNDAGSQVSIGQPWSWNDCIVAISLQQITPSKA